MLTKPPPGVMDDPFHPLSQGCVGHWLFNEGAGSLAYDVSGYGNHGALKNMSPNAQDSGWGSNKFGGGLTFDSADDYIDHRDVLDIGTPPMTICAWFKTTDYRNNFFVSKAFYGSPWIGYWIGIGDEHWHKVDVVFYGGGNVDRCTSVNNYDDGQWHFACGGRDGTNVFLYVDGVADGTPGTDHQENTDSSVHFQIGTMEQNSNRMFNGKMDNVRIYNRALSAEEIKQLYHDPFCNLLRVPAWQLYSPTVGLSIPVAMHYYEMLRV